MSKFLSSREGRKEKKERLIDSGTLVLLVVQKIKAHMDGQGTIEKKIGPGLQIRVYIS